DGADGQLASIMSIGIKNQNTAPAKVSDGPLKMLSPNGEYQVAWEDGIVTVTRLADKTVRRVPTDGVWPRFSPESKQLLWQTAGADSVPGTMPPVTQIWIANPDGSQKTQIGSQRGGSVYWLDEDRILMVQREPGTLITNINIYTISTKKTDALGS